MGKLKAGAAMCSITPDLDTLLKLAKAEGLKYDGIYETMYFRCIAVSDGEHIGVIGGYDLIFAPFCNKMADKLEETFGIDRDHIVFTATHNHEGLNPKLREGNDFRLFEKFSPQKGLYENPKPISEEMYEYSEWMFDQVFETISKAINSMVPAKVGYKKGTSYINASRDLSTPLGAIQLNDFHGPSDHELIVIRFDDLEGNTIGEFVNFGCHSNALVWNLTNGTFTKIAVDLGGEVSAFVENATLHKYPVIWAIGSSGDQNPIVRSVWRIVDVDSDGNFTMSQHVFHPETSLLQLKGISSTQGMEVLELHNQIKDFTDEVDFAGAYIIKPIPGRRSYSYLGLFSDVPNTLIGKKVSSNLKYGERPEPVPLNFDIPLGMRLFKLNDDIAFAGFGGEMYANLGFIIKDIVPADCTTLCELQFNDAGYIMDKERQEVNGFGTSMSMAWSGEVVNQAFEEGYTELVEKVYGK